VAVLSHYSLLDMTWIGLVLMLSGMNKGGFPIGLVATPLLILIWPEHSHAARSAIGFMLPMLCLMDFVAFLIYRKEIQWHRLTPLWFGAVVGIALASVLFVSDESSLFAVSDHTLKLCVGWLGLLFLAYFAARRLIFRRLARAIRPGFVMGTLFGISAGVTSTLAHAGAPVMQMYLLPQQLPKKQYVATNGLFFFAMNMIKLLPFAYLGRITQESLTLGGVMVPVIPLGVFAGWWLTHKTRQEHYTLLIYAILFTTSILLVVKG
jgi:uncharacterized membrane protein YfcA